MDAVASSSEARLALSLRELLGDDAVLTTSPALDRYAHDETEALFYRPAIVALPQTTEQVSRTLALATAERVPITPRGAGTGLSGGALPVRGGLVLGLERMDRIRAIDRRNLSVEAEAGVVLGRLQAAVEEQGLFYPP